MKVPIINFSICVLSSYLYACCVPCWDCKLIFQLSRSWWYRRHHRFRFTLTFLTQNISFPRNKIDLLRTKLLCMQPTVLVNQFLDCAVHIPSSYLSCLWLGRPIWLEQINVCTKAPAMREDRVVSDYVVFHVHAKLWISWGGREREK